MEVGSTYVSVMPSARGFGSKLSGQIGGDVDKAGKTSGSRFGKVFATASIKPFRAFGAAALGFFAVDKVKDFFGSAIDEARESQKVSALTAQVIKTTGGAANISAKQIGNLSTAISNKVGIDDEAIQSGANMLLTFTNVRNEVGKGNKVFNEATRLATDMSAALGGDAKSAALQLGKALNDPAKGVTKLARSGVSFTEQQIAQIKAMQESGNVLGAQKIILGEVSKEFGGAAAASATSGEKMGVAWGNLKETIGTALLPVLDKAEQVITAKIIPAVSNFVTQMQNGTGAGGQLVSVIKGIWAILSTVFNLIASNKTAFAILGGTIMTVVGAVRAWRAAQVLLDAVLTANPIGLIIVAIAALVAGLVVAYKKSETFRNIVNGAFSAVKSAGEAMWHALKAAFKFIVDAFLNLAGAIVNGAAKAFGWVPGIGPKLKGAAAAFNGFRDSVNASLSGIHKDVSVTVHAQLTGAAALNSLLSPKHLSRKPPASLPNTGNSLKDLLGPAPRAAVGALHATGRAVAKAAPKVKSDLRKRLESIIDTIGDGLSGKGKKGAANVQKVKDSLGKLTDSIKKQLDKQLQAAKDKVSKIADTISSLKDTIKQTASSVAQNYLPDFTTNALFGPDGKMIKGTAVSSFKDQISGKGSVIAQVTAAYKKLVSEGLNKDFLATLLQSGNNNLILDLGQSSKSDALSAQSMYQNVTAQATALGNAVANNTTAKAQLDTATKHLAVAQRQEQAAQRRENALNSISHKLDKLDKLKKLDTLDTDITRGLNRLISAANNGRRS